MKKIILLLITIVLSLSAASLDEKVAYLNNVKELVVLTQKMRGDTNVYVKGGDILLSEIDDDRDNVATSLRDLHHKFQTVDMGTNDEFIKLHRYMQSLNEVASELDTMTTFRAYSLLINEMLKLGVTVQNNFFVDGSERQKRVSAVMMKNILPMTEHIGKLRGLGAGMAACGQCDDDELTYTKEYFTDVSDDLNKLVVVMRALNASYPNSYPKNLDQQLERYQLDVKSYIELIETNISEAELGKMESITLDAYDFFSHGTSVIDHTLSFYEMNVMILKHQ
ncbi:MAG: hypothetical protein WBF77_12280 [Sulfurimonadaceae bacterium]